VFEHESNRSFFDWIYSQLDCGHYSVITTHLNPQLTELRRTLSEAAWQSEVCQPLRQHPLHALLLQDPYTERAYRKPRGYAGDAVMLDYLYAEQPPTGTTEIGEIIFRQTIKSPGGPAVVWRARHLAAEWDALAARQPQARVLSLACGHLREARFSTALAAGRLGVVLAVDQDADSLAVLRQDYGHLAVEPIEANVKALLKGELTFTDLHLAYAAGLYDYLPEPVAVMLTARLFSMLAPGGKLIVPNFLADNSCRGYMEAVMDWNLILRTPAEIEALGRGLPPRHIASRRYYQDPMEMVGYLEVTRTG
jgi:hypothetical protein